AKLDGAEVAHVQAIDVEYCTYHHSSGTLYRCRYMVEDLAKHETCFLIVSSKQSVALLSLPPGPMFGIAGRTNYPTIRADKFCAFRGFGWWRREIHRGSRNIKSGRSIRDDRLSVKAVIKLLIKSCSIGLRKK